MSQTYNAGISANGWPVYYDTPQDIIVRLFKSGYGMVRTAKKLKITRIKVEKLIRDYMNEE